MQMNGQTPRLVISVQTAHKPAAATHHKTMEANPLITPPPQSLIPSHTVATWLLGIINDTLKALGLQHNQTLSEAVYVAVIAVIAIVTGIVIKTMVLGVTRKTVALRNSPAGRMLLQRHTLRKCAHIVPPLVFMAFLPFAFSPHSKTLLWLFRLTGVYALVAFAIGLNAVMAFVFYRYDERDNTRNLPLKGILNVARGITWIIVTILAVSVIIDKSPATLLAGLGAFAAALMLIFKDSILGFVAGIQMSQNDMLHVGDWIVVPGTPANGTVLDVSLTTVKVQNFDNTIVTVPPYTLVQGAFQNWRGMSESGVRRIRQTFNIEYDSIAPLDGGLLQSVLKKYPSLEKYTAMVTAPAREGTLQASSKTSPLTQQWLVNGDIRLPNGSMETNLGLFRLYLCDYLIANPLVSPTHRVLVQLLEPNIYGLPLQIWCWANTTVWNAYESIQSAIIEHVATVAADFGLVIYSAGDDTVTLQGPVAGAPAKPLTTSAAQ